MNFRVYLCQANTIVILNDEKKHNLVNKQLHKHAQVTLLL